MSQVQDSGYRTFTTASDLSSSQYLIVKMTAAKTVGLATAATDVILGVLQNAPKSGDVATVALRSKPGTIKVKAGGTIALGDAVTSNGSSQAVTTTTAGNQILGYALSAAASGDIVEVMPSTAKV